ncbi:OmpA family protein [Pseudomonas asiatica]|uniref:OmpA family protein n=1 Tax=Pseudomonas asiatica TaxID=2219225 RepID=UPI0010BFA139|nr:OmpA family protein [Pseudomonas asiatica]
MNTLNRAILLASLALSASTAGAVDVRQVVVPDSYGVAIEPAHAGHALVESIRDTQQKAKSPVWTVTEPARPRALMPAEEALLDAEDAKIAEEARHTRTTLYFDFDKTMPTGWWPLTNVIADALRVGSTITLIGYADEVGEAIYNQRLSENRAIEAARYLVRHGVKKKNIKVYGRGKRDPVSNSDSSMNRRVEVDIVKAAGKPL